MPKTRKAYTAEFKLQAVQMIADQREEIGDTQVLNRLYEQLGSGGHT